MVPDGFLDPGRFYYSEDVLCNVRTNGPGFETDAGKIDREMGVYPTEIGKASMKNEPLGHHNISSGAILEGVIR